MQNTRGKHEQSLEGTSEAKGDISNSDTNMINTARSLYKKFGIRIFFDGMTPKLLRAAVNHSVTFFIFDLILRTVVDVSS